MRIYSAQVSQAALAGQPVPNATINTFTLGGAAVSFVVAVNGAPSGTTAPPVLLSQDMGWYLYTTKLPAPLKEGQTIVIHADGDVQVYRVTYGEYQSIVGLILMWGLLRV